MDGISDTDGGLVMAGTKHGDEGGRENSRSDAEVVVVLGCGCNHEIGVSHGASDPVGGTVVLVVGL